MIQPKFYEVNLGQPLNQDLGSPNWSNTVLGRLERETDGACWLATPDRWELDEMKTRYGHMWQVVNAYWSIEDTTMTRFQAFGADQEHFALARFGVTYSGCSHKIDIHAFSHPLKTDHWLVPVDNQIHTPNTGGYEVQVLDYLYPSEVFHFGMHKSGQQHKALVIMFQLLPIDLPKT